MDLKHIIPQQRRRTYGPSFDIAFSTDKSNVSRVGPSPTHSRASSGTFVNENGRIVGKTRSTTSLNPASVPVGGVAVFAVPSGSVVGWLNNSIVVVMEDTDGDDQIGAQRHITGTLIHKTDTAITLLVTSKSGTTTLSSWFVSYRGLRNDHDPVTGLCRGALIEESRTNALQHSANFKNTTSSNYWENLSATTVTVDQIASPDGGVNADLLATSTTSFDCFARRHGIFTGSTQYTYSIFLKQGPSGYRYVGLYIGAGISAQKFPFFDFDNPTTVQIPSGTMVGTINSTRVDAYPNGWYRVSVTFTTAATPVTTFCGVYISQSGGTIPAFSAAGLNAYIWGIQVELGSFPTSYIPTTAAATIRSADVYNITNTAPFWNSSEFTLLTKANFLSSGVDAYASNFNITSGFFGVRRPNTNQAVGIIRSSGVNADIPFGANGSFTTGSMRMALAHSTGQQAGSLNGAVTIQQNSAFAPTSNPIFNIGSSNTSASSAINGHIASIKYFRNRLPNVQLQALTAITSEPIVYNGVAIWYNGVGIIETN